MFMSIIPSKYGVTRALILLGFVFCAVNIVRGAGSDSGIVTASALLESKTHAPEPWSGFDPERYRDMAFYDNDGAACLRGRVVDYSPDSQVKTFAVTTRDDLKGSVKVYTGNINPDGTFELDIPLPYPQYDRLELGETIMNLFLSPGDTLSIVTSVKRRDTPAGRFLPVYYGFEGDIDDGVAVNVLADSVRNLCHIADLWDKYGVADNDSMKINTYINNGRLCDLLDSVASGLPAALADWPISGFAKDILCITAIGDICEMMESLDDTYRYITSLKRKAALNAGQDVGPEDKLDQETLMAPRRKHLDIIYDNPLLICKGWLLPNRWKYSTLFRNTGLVAYGMSPVIEGNGYFSTDETSGLVKSDVARLDSLGIGNCFVAQLVRTAKLMEYYNSASTPSSGALERCRHLIGNLLRYNDYEVMSDVLLSGYGNILKDVMIAENQLAEAESGKTIIIEGSDDDDILEKIIAPYRGNVLFIDFWGIWCGVCRSGMMGQKPMLAEYAGKPFKALYIANVEDGVDRSNKWLRNENIGGEHIFVSGDDWNRLRSLLNFSGLPFGMIIDEEGKIVNTGCHMPEQRYLLDNILKDK